MDDYTPKGFIRQCAHPVPRGNCRWCWEYLMACREELGDMIPKIIELKKRVRELEDNPPTSWIRRLLRRRDG